MTRLEPQPAAGQLPFTDAGQVSPWAMEAVTLAWQNGLIQGVGGARLAPAAQATRAQAATVFLRALRRMGSIEK